MAGQFQNTTTSALPNSLRCVGGAPDIPVTKSAISVMLDLNTSESSKPRCLVSSTKLAGFLNHEQPPSKKRPFSTILNHTFNHTANAPNSNNLDTQS